MAIKRYQMFNCKGRPTAILPPRLSVVYEVLISRAFRDDCRSSAHISRLGTRKEGVLNGLNGGWNGTNTLKQNSSHVTRAAISQALECR